MVRHLRRRSCRARGCNLAMERPSKLPPSTAMGRSGIANERWTTRPPRPNCRENISGRKGPASIYGANFSDGREVLAMSTIPNPLYAGFTPTNPTGTQVSVPGSPTSSGANPLLPSTGTSSSAPGSTNPLTAGFTSSTVPTFGANGPGATSLTGAPAMPATNVAQAASSPIGGMSSMSPQDISKLYSGLSKTYGDGPAHAILDFL